MENLILDPTGLLLWAQPALLLGVFAATARPGWRVLRGLRWHPATLGLAVAAPLVIALLLPASQHHFAGHEGAYGELLRGGLPREDLASFRILPLPSGVAAALGWLLPGDLAEGLWLAGNRAALGGVLLLGAASGELLARRSGGDERRAGLVTALGLLAVAPLLGWSATAFGIVPALACGAACVAFGLARNPGAALAWGALALASRLEVAPLLLAGGLLAWPALRQGASRRIAIAGLVAGLAVLAVEALALLGKGASLPVEGAPGLAGVAFENLRALRLGGAWTTPWTAGLLAGLLVASRAHVLAFWPIALALALACGQLLGLADLGARHLLPASLLAAVLAGGLATSRPWIAGLLGPVLVAGALGLADLQHRYAAGSDAHLPRWVRAADAGGARTLGQGLDPDCYAVTPRGEEDLPGSAWTGDVREIHNAALELRGGGCVQWFVEGEAEFLGDCGAERLDRAIRILGLRPTAWIERGERTRWLLWEAR